MNMEYTNLGGTDIKVSKICLGTMTFGEQNTEEEAFQQMDYALQEGVNFFDTAEIYSVPTRKNTYGRTEEYVGKWLRSRKNREKIILATKVAGPGLPYIREGSRLSKQHIIQAVEESLKRLHTDYIDLYQVHWPERETNFFGRTEYKEPTRTHDIKIEESVEALDTLVKQGKINYVGISNETGWGVAEYLKIASKRNQCRIVSIQNPYNLLNRNYELELAEYTYYEKVGLLAYSPLAFGVLTGKYLNNQQPAKGRLTLYPEFNRYTKHNAMIAVQKYYQLAQKHNITLTQMALAFINSKFFVTSNIIGATTLEQLKENIGSMNIKLTPEIIDGIDAIHKEIPTPAP